MIGSCELSGLAFAVENLIGRMIAVALDLGRAAIVRLGQQRHGPTASRHGRGIILRHAMDIILRLLPKWPDFLLRPTTTAQTQSGQEKRSRHDLDKVPPGNWIDPFARASGKFALDPLTELRRISELIETAPILGAALRLRARWRNGFHRWQ